MDTKLKSSKKFSFFVAGILVMLAVAVFMAFYPVFERQAADYYTDPLKSEELLQYFYKGNLVFYKKMLDKVRQEEVSYSDLYLLTEEENIPEEERPLEDSAMNGQMEFVDERTIWEYKDTLKRTVNSVMEGWENDILDTVFKNIDYCVVDHKTGEILKNTGRNMEALYEDKSRKDEEVPYVYYVMMSYDDAGNLVDLAVRDEKPDDLFKNVQGVMAYKWLANHLIKYYNYNVDYFNTVYFENEGKKLVYRINEKPEGMTFIYACTQQQKESIMEIWKNDSFMWQYRYEIRWAYYQAGTSEVYWFILAVLAIAALFLTRIKSYCLHRLSGAQIYMEISLSAIACMIGMEGLIRELVCRTSIGFFTRMFGEYLSSVPVQAYPVLEGIMNAAVLSVVFGCWFYMITTLGAVFDLGLKEFIKERSFLVKIICWMKHGIRKRTNQLKEEVLHVDLGGEAEGTVRKLVLINFLFVAVVCFMWMFGWVVLIFYTAVLYIGLKKYVRKIQEQYRKLLTATRSIADGNLQTEFEDDWGVFESYKEELAKIQNGFRAAVDEEVRSQKMKTELITNVSHDLKTPLTAITTYIELLEEENTTPEQRKEYLKVLAKKSNRLKFLIEDLFEVSKASSGNITLNPVDVDICHLMRQVYLEYEDKVEEADLIFRFQMPDDKVILQLDSQKTYRVFENLYVNIIKYAMPHTRVYVSAQKTEKGIHIELKNMSATELNIPVRDLTERFVRGDSSRNTEGSGLGLAIARCFVELQGGVMKLEIDGDLFKVAIDW